MKNSDRRALETAMIELEKENTVFKTRTDLLQKEVQTLRKSVEGLYHMTRTYPATLKHILLNKKTRSAREKQVTPQT